MIDWVLNLNHLSSLRIKSIDVNDHLGDLELKPLRGLVKLSFNFLFRQVRNPSIVYEF